MTEMFAFAIAFSILAFIRIMATKDHPFGRFCRWYWNFGFRIAAVIPFCGWMEHFVIPDEEL